MGAIKYNRALRTAGTALIFVACAQNAEAAILLSEFNVQGQYALVADASQPGFNIAGTIQWANFSDPYPANNQISANGSFGSNQGLYKIDTDDGMHEAFPPTYTINPDSFNIQYADGVVNMPNQSDTFKFYFNLGPGVSTETQAQGIVDALNAVIAAPGTYAQDLPYLYRRGINGTVAANLIPEPFENTPSVYVIPEPSALMLVSLGGLLILPARRLFRWR